MSWGAIYTQSWWGRAIANDFGEVYSDEVNIKPLLKSAQDRSTYYENEAGTTALLQQLEECQLVETLGEELIVNGDFSDGSTGWNLGAGWSVDENELKATSGTASWASQDVGGIENKTYTIEVKAVVDLGSFYIYFGQFAGVPHFKRITRSGTYSFTEKWSNNTNFGLYKLSTFSGSIENVSVKEIIQTA